MTRSPAQRSLDAETRGIESGHRAFVQPDGSVRVVSDTHPNKWYEVRFTGLHVGDPIVFTCTPHGDHAYSDDHLELTGPPGVTACMHAALAARRLELERLAYWSYEAVSQPGPWRASEKAAEVTASRLPPLPADPWEGLPK